MKITMSSDGIFVQFSCKLCQSCFETVEDYIKHKQENHVREFRKTCFIVFEERNHSIDSIDNNTHASSVDLDLDEGEMDIQSFSQSPSSSIPLKEERTESDDENSTNDPLSSNIPLAEFDSVAYATHVKNPPQCISNFQKSGRNTISESGTQEDKARLSTVQDFVHENISSAASSNSSPAHQSNSKHNTPSSGLQCKLCLRTFNSKPALVIHGNICVLYHPSRGSYCSQCNYLFSSTSALNHHMTFHSTSKEPENVMLCEDYYSELDEIDEPEIPETECTLAIDSDSDNDPLSLQKIPGLPPPIKKIKLNVVPQVESEMNEKLYPKPLFSFSSLISLALKNSRNGSLQVNQIYKFICHHFPYFESAKISWKNSLRHCLCTNYCFRKIELLIGGSLVKNCRWAVNPSRIQKMDRIVQNQLMQNPHSIRSSMRDPENLEKIQEGALKGDSNDSEEDDDAEGLLTFNSNDKPLYAHGRVASRMINSPVLKNYFRNPQFDQQPGEVNSSALPCFAAPILWSTGSTLIAVSLPENLQVNPPTLTNKCYPKSDPDQEPVTASDFCEVINVQGNYSR